jgi:hypothetical protein
LRVFFGRYHEPYLTSTPKCNNVDITGADIWQKYEVVKDARVAKKSRILFSFSIHLYGIHDSFSSG